MVNRFDQPFLSGRDDGQGSLPVVLFQLARLVKSGKAEKYLSRAQIEHEILNSRDLSKKGPPQRRLAYAMRTASKAIALSSQ